MKQSSLTRIAFVTMVVTFGLISAASAGVNEVVAKAREKVTIDIPCKVGEEMKFVIPDGQTARLDCQDLGIGLTEVLFWSSEKYLVPACVWANGQISINGRPIGEKQREWVPAPPRIWFQLEWDSQEDSVTVRILAQIDDDIIQEKLRPLLAPKENKKVDTIGPEERLAGFIRLWSEVKYNFVFFDQVPDLDWDKVLQEYLPRVQKDQTVEQYYKLLQECIARLEDGHTEVYPPRSQIEGRPLLLIRPVEGKAVVTDLAETKDITQAGITRGTVITKIDDRPVDEILKQDIYPYVSSSTPQFRDRVAYSRLLRGPAFSKVTISFQRPDGSSGQAVLTRRITNREAPFARPVTECRELPGEVFYIALNSFGSKQVIEEFDKAFEKIRQSNGLIIDVRNNGGGNGGFAKKIVGRLIAEPLQSSCWKTRKYMPAYRAWGEKEQWHVGDISIVKPRGNKPFLGPVVVLTGPGTISAAEDFLIPLHAGKRAVLVGEKTAGTTGQPLFIKLPGGGKARICTKRDTYPDGREFVGVGVIPDIQAHNNMDDILSGRDAALEKAMEIIKAKSS